MIAVKKSKGVSLKIWDAYPDFALSVKKTHEDLDLSGHHDWAHAFRVGEIARKVSLDEWKNERLSHLAGIAGLAHNADRLVQKKYKLGHKKAPGKEIEVLVLSWLKNSNVNKSEAHEIIKAVLKHDEKNHADDSRILIALKDGDRVVGLDADLFIRAGQYWHDLPAVDLKNFLNDPTATYRDPKSVLNVINQLLEWADPATNVSCRTRLGIAMAQDRADTFRLFFKALKKQLKSEGIHPYPF